MLYTVLKALHIIFMVSYFAGVFYLVRIFVYYKDTDDFTQPKQNILREQYIFMARRLWNIITVPAGVLMLVFGIAMLIVNPALLDTPWFRIKIILLFALLAYHLWCFRMVLKLKKLNGKSLALSNLGLRQMNEVATIILSLVVFTVILKSMMIEYWWQVALGLIVTVVVLMGIVKLVNRNKRKKK